MNAEVNHIIRKFKERIQELYGSRLRDVILYGSFARGDATAASDIDLAIVLGGSVSPVDEIDRMVDIVTDLNLEHNVLISVYPLSEDNYASVNSPVLMNLRREGVLV